MSNDVSDWHYQILYMYVSNVHNKMYLFAEQIDVSLIGLSQTYEKPSIDY